jgi:hypothetical protein
MFYSVDTFTRIQALSALDGNLVQDFVHAKVEQVRRDFVDKLINADAVTQLVEKRMSNSSELDGTTLEVRTIEVLLELEKCFRRNMGFLNLGTPNPNGERRDGSSSLSSTLPVSLEPPWDLLNVTNWGTKYDSFMDKSVHKTYFTQLYKQISDELGIVPPSLRVHRYLPEMFGALWYAY